MEIENVSWVEFSYYNWALDEWSKWERFDSTRLAVTHAQANLTRGTLYKIQEIRSRVLSV